MLYVGNLPGQILADCVRNPGKRFESFGGYFVQFRKIRRFSDYEIDDAANACLAFLSGMPINLRA